MNACREPYTSSLNGYIMLIHARATDLCKLPLETCQIHYGTSVGCESNILHDFFSFAATTSLVSETSKLSEKRFSTNQNHFENKK